MSEPTAVVKASGGSAPHPDPKNIQRGDGVWLCGRNRSKGRGPCPRRAGFQTTHPGIGACKYHGGLQRGDARVKNGRYSLIAHVRIGELVDKFRADPDPLNLLDEVAMLRALTQHFIEEHEEVTEALLAWFQHWRTFKRALPKDLVSRFDQALLKWEMQHRSDDDWFPGHEEIKAHVVRLLATLRGDGDAPAPPRKMPDIADAAKILAETGRMVERIERMRTANAISEPELNRIIGNMARVLDVLVVDQELKEKVRDQWMQVVIR